MIHSHPPPLPLNSPMPLLPQPQPQLLLLLVPLQKNSSRRIQIQLPQPPPLLLLVLAHPQESLQPQFVAVKSLMFFASIGFIYGLLYAVRHVNVSSEMKISGASDNSKDSI